MSEITRLKDVDISFDLDFIFEFENRTDFSCKVEDSTDRDPIITVDMGIPSDIAILFETYESDDECMVENDNLTDFQFMFDSVTPLDIPRKLESERAADVVISSDSL
jgi:hypothetical protein